MTVKPGSINMGRILRHMAQRTNQSRKVTFYRAPLYTTDDYGVEGGVEAEAEIQLPGLPALIRPALTADYRRQRSGQNIIGAGRVYTANLSTIKGMPNFNQDNNENFNEIEGWDKFIDTSRVVYKVPTSVTTDWSGTGSLASDGQSLTLTASDDGNLLYETSAKNTLEADRLRFKIKGSGAVELKAVRSYHGGTNSTFRVNWDNTNFILLDDNWLSIDVPFISGTTNTSIYQTGIRYDTPVTTGVQFNYAEDLRIFRVEYNADSGDTLQIKDVEYYKSLEWSVHSVKELNDDFNVFNVVRTAGRIDSRRRADAS